MQDVKQVQPLKGINRDMSPEFSEDGSYLYALNAIKNLSELESIQNEFSNQLCVELPYPVIGSIHIANTKTLGMEFVVFLTDNISSEIGIFNPDLCTYKKLDVACNLNFNKRNLIRGVYKILDACNERVIYWTDGVNPYRVLNIDRANQVENCEQLNLFNCVNDDVVVTTTLNDSGGFLNVGVYQVGVRYVTASGATTQLVYLSQLMPVIDEVPSLEWRYRDGAPPETLTTKSITLQISSLNTNQAFVQVVIFKYENSTVQAYVSEKLPTEGSELVYRVTGVGETPVPLAEVLVGKAFYKTGNLIAVHQDRLYLADVEQSRHINYQQLANQITVKWKTVRLPLTEDNYKENYSYKTWMGDERYALGIVWKFCDGTYSKAFHIPGTKQTPCFTGINSKLKLTNELLEENNTYQDVTYTDPWETVPENDINNFYECPKYVWEVFNTAGICSSPQEDIIREYDDCGILISETLGVWEEGHLGYHQQEEKYPATKDCNGNYIYPHTIVDGQVVMDNVRHHLIPDRRLVPHFSSLSRGTECDSVIATPAPWEDKHIFPIALELDNVTPPTDAELPVVGYELVYVRRTDANKSVVAKGLIHNTFLATYAGGTVGAHPMYSVNGLTQNDGNGALSFTAAAVSLTPYSGNTQVNDWYTSKQVKFHSPDTAFRKGIVSGQQLKVEQYWRGFGRVYAAAGFEDAVGDMCCAHRYNMNMCDYRIHPYMHNMRITKSSYLPAHKIVGGFTYPFINYHQESGVGLELNRRPVFKLNWTETAPDNCITVNAFAALVADFSHRKYVSGSPCNSIGCGIAYYGSIKRLIDYPSITRLVYTRTGALRDNNLFFGDAFINYWVYRRTALVRGTWLLNCWLMDGEDGDPESTLIHGIYESDTNVDCRHEGDTKNSEFYYPKMGNGEFYVDPKAPGFAKADSCILTQWRYNTETNQYVNTGIDNYTGYNRDYSATDMIEIFPAIEEDYKSCECDDRLINSVVVSDPDTGDDIVDGWRTFRANNVITVPRTTGKLMNILSMTNNFYAHTTNNIWRFLTSQTQIESTTSSVYLGSNDIMSTVAQYLYMVPEGFAGTRQRNGSLITSQGYHFIDSETGTLFVLGENISIMNKGLTKWLTDNLKFKLLETVPNYPNTDNPLLGIGWHITMDNEYKRLLITKRDYAFKDPLIYGGNYNEINCEVGKIYLVQDRLVLVVDPDCSYTILSLDDEEYFCNSSWTLSYSYLLQAFMSWHSYHPYRYLHTASKLFSVIDTNIYQHNIQNNYQTFYNNYYPFDIEFASKASSIVQWDSVSYMQDAYEYLPAYKKEIFRDVTFTHGLVYNSNQTSGWFEFVYKNDLQADNMQQSIQDGSVRVNRIEKMWHYNEFVDYTTSRDEPHMLEECGSVVEQPNQQIIDNSKPYYSIMPFRDNYIVQRLRLDNSTLSTTRFNVKLFLNTITNSIR